MDFLPCPCCGTDHSSDAEVCRVCHYQFVDVERARAEMSARCGRCASPISEEQNACEICGLPRGHRRPRPETASLNVRDLARGDAGRVAGGEPEAVSQVHIPPLRRRNLPPAPRFNPPVNATTWQPQAEEAGEVGHTTDFRAHGVDERQPNSSMQQWRVAAERAADSMANASTPPVDASAPGGGVRVHRNKDRNQGVVEWRPGPPAPMSASRSTTVRATPPIPRASGAGLAIAGRSSNIQHRPLPGTHPAMLRSAPESAGHGRQHYHDFDGPEVRSRNLDIVSDLAESPVQRQSPAPRIHYSAHSAAPDSAEVNMRIVVIQPDGSEGHSLALPDRGLEIGRGVAGLAFPDDPFVSPIHALLMPRGHEVELRDLDSRNGVYVRIVRPMVLGVDDTFLIGRQLLRVEPIYRSPAGGYVDQDGVRAFGSVLEPAWARLSRLVDGGEVADIFTLRHDDVVIGRDVADISFPDDSFMSRRHARVRREVSGGREDIVLDDLGSANGTYVRIRGRAHLRAGDYFRVGDEVLMLAGT